MGCDVNPAMLKYTLIFLTFRNTGGFLNTPTPGGVPVKNTSPGQRVTNLQEKNNESRSKFIITLKSHNLKNFVFFMVDIN